MPRRWSPGPRGSWACCLAAAEHSVCPGSWASRRRWIGSSRARPWVSPRPWKRACWMRCSKAIGWRRPSRSRRGSILTRRCHPRGGGPPPPPPPADAAALFGAAREKARKQARGLDAPLQCIACVEKSLDGPLQEGLTFERQRFVELVNGTQSKALRHLFFGEREAAKPPPDARGVALRPVQRVGVIGAGTMGGGIAMAFANAGYAVTLVEISEAALAKGLETSHRNDAARVVKGKRDEAQMQARLARIYGSTAMPDLAQADLIIEAAFEDIAVKHGLFQQ